MQIGGAEVLAVWWRKNVGNSFKAPVPRVSFHPPRNFNDQIVLQTTPPTKNLNDSTTHQLCGRRFAKQKSSPRKDIPLKRNARPWKNVGFETILSFLGIFR